MENSITVGIVTIDDYTNYGNRLQNYALTKLLEGEGINVINGIRVYSKEDWVKEENVFLKRIIKRVMPFRLIKDRLYRGFESDDKCLIDRRERFIEFIESYTTIIDPIIAVNNKKANKELDSYNIDCYITGSDQVWNPYFGGKSYEFLSFADKDKRYSFSASIGVESIPVERQKLFSYYLKDFKYISVREERAAQIVKELTGKEPVVTLDPTFLIPSGDWKALSQKPDVKLEERYICTYFLGKIPDAVFEFAKEKDLPVRQINTIADAELFCLDPAEFLYLIENAEHVLTDSFHAVVFSIIFHKSFYIFKREQKGSENMFSRIESIANRFGLEKRVQNGKTIEERNETINWNDIDFELKKEKEKSVGELLRAMGCCS